MYIEQASLPEYVEEMEKEWTNKMSDESLLKHHIDLRCQPIRSEQLAQQQNWRNIVAKEMLQPAGTERSSTRYCHS